MDEDMGRTQLFNVISGITDSNSAAVMEAMPHRLCTANDAFNVTGHDVIAEQRDDDSRRTSQLHANGCAQRPTHRGHAFGPDEEIARGVIVTVGL